MVDMEHKTIETYGNISKTNIRTDGSSHPRASGQLSEASSALLHQTIHAHTALAAATGHLRRTIPTTRIARPSTLAAWSAPTSASTLVCACARLSSRVRD